jgi:S-adenosylmethionine synthetase
MNMNYIFSSESVGEGHPDKVCDTISDAVLDACLTQDPRSRVACECYAKCNLVVVGGEITSSAKIDYNGIVREAVRDIGYVNDDDVFHADRIFIVNVITRQSPDMLKVWMLAGPKVRPRLNRAPGTKDSCLATRAMKPQNSCRHP